MTRITVLIHYYRFHSGLPLCGVQKGSYDYMEYYEVRLESLFGCLCWILTFGSFYNYQILDNGCFGGGLIYYA